MFLLRRSCWLLAFPLLCTAQSWKTYPYSLDGYPELEFPTAEAAHYQYQSDSWFMTAQVTGQTTGKKYQIVTILDRNYITAVLLNFYQVCAISKAYTVYGGNWRQFSLQTTVSTGGVSIFEYSTGDYVTYTDYDLPGIDLIDMKYYGSGDHLNLSFNSGAGKAKWSTVTAQNGSLKPFNYNLHLPGTDSQGGGSFMIDITANMQHQPVAYGASTLKGVFTFYAQPDTHTYFQTGPLINGTLTYKGVTETVTGTAGHLDRQWFPLYSGIFTPTGRQHSHEWRQINLNNSVDLAIWRQFDRVNNNSIIETSGTTSYLGEEADPTWVDALPSDLTVEYISYSKYPRQKFTTLIPPPSANMYLPANHIVRSVELDMELQCTYVNPAPAVTLPIEYFEGPAYWNGTYLGNVVEGFGIFESTLGLYRDFELAGVLYDSVVHLPESSFSVGMSRAQVATVVAGVKKLVSDDPLMDDRVAAGLYINGRIMPALETMVDSEDRESMETIANDLEASLALVG